jgi:glycosyltransferase involved in cell wall biosynthesis
MKLLIVSKAFVSATYRQKLDELARLGIEVIAVTPDRWREGGSVQRLEPASHPCYDLIVSPIRWNGRFHLHYYPRLPAIIRDRRPDLIHLDEEPYNLATFLGTRAARRTSSLFFTWQNLLRRYPPPFRQMERYVHHHARGAIAGTEEAAAVLRAKCYAGPLAVIPQFGVDPDVFSPGPPPTGPIRFGFLNRLIPGKAPLHALEAFARLPNDCCLEIVGDGPLRPALEAEIARRGLANRVRLRPRLPSTEMPDLLRSLHAALLPSLTMPAWKEQFGRILVEAMACEVSVIGSDSGEIPSVIGDAGLIVPEDDVDALAAAMDRVRTDGALRAELSRRGRERVLSQFTNKRIARRSLDFYELLLAR